MSEGTGQTLGFYEQRGDLELGRGDVISTGDLANFPGSYPVYSSSAVGEGIFGRYGRYMFDEELITWSIDGGGRPFHRRRHRFSVTNVCGFLRVKRPDRWDYGYLHAILEKLQSGIQFDYQMKAHPSVIRDLYRFDCIPIEEQQRICAVRDTLDTTIRQTEAIIEKLKQVKQGLLHDLLTRGIDANGELRPPQSQAPHLYKDSPIGRIPRGWQVLSMDEMVAAPICYGIVQVFAYVPDGIPVLAIKDLLGDYTTGVHRTARHIDTAYARSRVKPGDVLVSIKGTIGRVGVVPDHYDGNISRDMARLRPGPLIRSGYFGQLLNSPIGQQILGLALVGTTRAELSIAPLRKLQFAIPDTNEQAVIEQMLSVHDKRLKAEVITLSKLQATKSGLMDDLLTGRVRVTPLLA